MSITIYHNPACGTSRNTLAMVRASGVEPEVIEYLTTPPSRARLIELIAAMGDDVRALIREKGTPYEELGLANPDLSQDRGHGKRRQAVPPIRIGLEFVRQPQYRSLCQRRRRGGYTISGVAKKDGLNRF